MTVDDGPLTCDRSTDDAGLGFLAYRYYSTLTAIAEASVYVGRETTNGHRMEVVDIPYGNGVQRVWLDERSLLPLRFRFPETRDNEGNQFEPGKIVTITDINHDRPILRPAERCDA